MFNWNTALRVLPAVAFVAAILLKSKDIAEDSERSKSTAKSRWVGWKLSNLHAGTYFRFAGSKTVYRKIGVHPMVESVLNPFLSHLVPFVNVDTGLIAFEAGNVRVHKVTVKK